MRINNNIPALNTHRQMLNNTNNATKAMEKLSSGMRINRASDDAAGLSISEKMRSQIASMEMASRNAQDGISYLQTAEGALSEVSSMLTRMKELTIQKENGVYNQSDIDSINLEIDALTEEIDNIVDNTNFNDKNVFKGSVDIAVTPDGTAPLTIGAATLTETLALTNASTAAKIDTAIEEVSAQRAIYGAAQNRLEHTINNLATTKENLSAAESRIRDTDMAKEMTTLTKNNILLQASQAMLAQANQFPQGVLQLLQ